MFGERFQQIKVATGKYALDISHDVGVVKGVLNVVCLAGATVGQCDLQIELQGLRDALFPFVHADECFNFEFA